MRRLALVVVLLFSLAALWLASFPLQTLEGFTRARLRWKGVRPLTLGSLRGWERDACQGKQPCQCVALVHGLADTALTWAKQLERNDWQTPMRLIAIDLPGTGQSAAPAAIEGYRVREQAKALRAALEPVCPQWTVVGNSLGGWIAGWLAVDWPQGVRKLLLVDAAGVTLREDLARLFLPPTRESLETFLRAAFLHPAHYPDFFWRAAVARIAESSAPKIVRVQDSTQLLNDHLKDIRARTEVLWGALDKVFTPVDGKVFWQGIPGATWTELAECSHVPQRECAPQMKAAIEKLVGEP